MLKAISGGSLPAASLIEALSLSDPKEYIRILQKKARVSPHIEQRTNIEECAHVLELLHQWQKERLLPITDFVRAIEKINALEKESAPLREHMFNANLRLVVWWVNRLYGRPDLFRFKNQNLKLEYLDLIQEGNIGLLTAVQRYRPEGGAEFGSYASWWIRQRITRASQDSQVIRIPSHMRDQIREAKATSLSLQFDKERAQNLADFGWLERVLRKEQDLEETVRHFSAPITTLEGALFGIGNAADDSERTLASIMPTQEPGPVEDSIRRESQQIVRLFVSRLSSQDQKVLLLRYGIPEGPTHLVGAVAEQLGLQEHEVSKIELLALKKLRVLLKSHSIITDPDKAQD